MTTTLDVYSAFLKEFYLPDWIDQLNTKSTTYKMLRRELVDFLGSQMVVPLRTSRNWGIGGVATSSSGSLSTLKTPGRQGIARTTVDGKLITGGILVAQDTMEKSRGRRGAFYDALDWEMQGLVDDTSDYMDLLAYGKGGGTIARITSVAGAPTMEVNFHRPFFVNLRIEAWDTEAAGTLQFTGDPDGIGAGARIVLAVARNNDGSGDITCTNITGAIAGDFIARMGDRTASAGLVPMGLAGIVDTANPPLESSFQGINRSTAGNEYFHGIEDTAAVITPSESIIQQYIDIVADDSNGNTNVLCTQRITRKAFYDTMNATQQRFVNTNVIQAGYLSGNREDMNDDYDWLRFDGRIPIVVDKYATIEADPTTGPVHGGYVWGLDLDSLYYALITDWNWWAPEGEILHRADSRQFGVQADLFFFGNMVCDAPKKNFKILLDIA